MFTRKWHEVLKSLGGLRRRHLLLVPVRTRPAVPALHGEVLGWFFKITETRPSRAGEVEDLMRQLMLTALAVVFCVAATSVASAQEEGGVQVTDRTPVDQRTADCVRRCLDQQSADHCRRARRGARQAWRRLLVRLENYESRIEQLEARVGGLTDRDPELEGQLTELADRVEQLNVRIDALVQLTGEIEEVQRRIGALEEGQERQDRELAAARERLAALGARISETQQREGVVQLGMNGGYMSLYSLDGPWYHGGFAGARLSLRITRLVSVFGELQAALSYAQYPAGLRGRGGVQIEFLDGSLVLEAGVGVLWTGYDSHLDAESAWLTADVGLEFRPHPVVGIGLNYLAGVEFDQDGTEFATGGSASLAIYIPRF